MASSTKNEGEGNRTAAKAYNRATTAFAKSGRVPGSAAKAAKAVAGPEKQSLAKAEKAGRARSKGEDRLLYKAK